MKHKYFGDVNDFRKYGLLRMLIGTTDLRLGVCWMLTEADDRKDGRLREYLEKPDENRLRDPDLFDALKALDGTEPVSRMAGFEQSGLLSNARFHSEILQDCATQRSEYFERCTNNLAGCDLVFFDPDNGLEVQSIRPGHKNSCKYLFMEEVVQFFESGASVLIYQHFCRRERTAYIAERVSGLRQRLPQVTLFSFKTPHVVFLLAARPEHSERFRQQRGSIASQWGKDEIEPTEHLQPHGA